MSADALNAIAWGDFVMFAFSDKDVRASFERETGKKLSDQRNGGTDNTEAFVEWVTRTQWGIEFAPAAYREKLAKAAT